jgi:hypothetical protein
VLEQIYVKQYEKPLSVSDLAAIETIGREQGVFCSIASDIDHADSLTRRRQAAHFRPTSLRAIIVTAPTKLIKELSHTERN